MGFNQKKLAETEEAHSWQMTEVLFPPPSAPLISHSLSCSPRYQQAFKHHNLNSFHKS